MTTEAENSNPHRLPAHGRNPQTLSLTPCFSWVRRRHEHENRFNGLLNTVETVETVPRYSGSRNTQLKQGVNERRQTRQANVQGVRTDSEKGRRALQARFTDFGFRPSDFLRISAFGFRPSNRIQPPSLRHQQP